MLTPMLMLALSMCADPGTPATGQGAQPKPTDAPSAKSPAASASAAPAPAIPTTDPADGTAVRIGGDREAKISKREDGSFVFQECLIDTPLPVGYPEPTAPGAIELKRYPVVRRAEVTGKSAPDLGSNFAFWPLFNHIKDRNIEMTSPVEMNYSNIDKNPPDGGDVVPESWTMSFLYRRVDQGPLGADEKRKNVKVVDSPAVTVIALGVRGPYGFQRMRKQWKLLETWLSEQNVWDAAGEPRVFYYNGPDRRERDKWAEVQIPVKLMKPAAATTTTPANSASSSEPATR